MRYPFPVRVRWNQQKNERPYPYPRIVILSSSARIHICVCCPVRQYLNRRVQGRPALTLNRRSRSACPFPVSDPPASESFTLYTLRRSQLHMTVMVFPLAHPIDLKAMARRLIYRHLCLALARSLNMLLCTLLSTEIILLSVYVFAVHSINENGLFALHVKYSASRRRVSYTGTGNALILSMKTPSSQH